MHGRPHLGGYYITLEQHITQAHHMADLYTVASRILSGDKKDLLLRIAQEEKECAIMLQNEYKSLFCCEPKPPISQVHDDVSIKQLIRLEADNAIHFSHLSENAPNKRLLAIYRGIAEKATNHSYLLLLIL